MVDDNFDDPMDQILSDMGMCGCGLPDEVLGWVAGLLELCENRAGFDEIQSYFATSYSGHIAEYAIWYWLDSRGLLEHGGSIGGSWLTDKGRDMIGRIRKELDITT